MDRFLFQEELQEKLNQKEKEQNFYIRKDLRACFVKINQTQTFSESEKKKFAEAVNNLTEALNYKNYRTRIHVKPAIAC